MKNKKLVILSMALCVSLILSYVDSLIPYNFVIPGIKMGLTNIAIVFALYKFGIKEAILISLLRVFMMGVLFNNGLTFLYSLSGAILSLVLMIILKKFNVFDEYGVSISGAISHNIGQLICAYFLLKTNVLIYYLPYLLLSGLLSGLFVGILSAVTIKRVNV